MEVFKIIAFFAERFTSDTIGGVKSYFRRIVPLLNEQGIETIILTLKTKNNNENYEKINGMDIYRVDAGDLPDRISKFNDASESERESLANKLFKKNDIETSAIKLSKSLNSFIREHKPRVIHFHNSYFLIPYALYFMKQNHPMKYPPTYYFWNHSPNKSLILPDGSKDNLYSALKSFQNLFKQIFSISKSAHNSLLKSGINSKVKYLGIDHKTFQKRHNITLDIRKRFNIPEDDFILLYTGRIIKDKGLDLIPEIFAELVKRDKKYETLHMIITGEGDYKNELQSIIDSKDMTSNIHLTRVFGDSEIIDVYSQANCFILPSRREALGLSLLEAMSCSLPCIASDLPGIREVITHTLDGILVPVDRTTEYVRWIDGLCSSEKLRTELIKNARKTIIEKFSFEKHVKYLKMRLLS